MADVYVSTGTLTGQIKTAYQKEIEYAFQSDIHFLQAFQRKQWQLGSEGLTPNRGDVVAFDIYSDISVQTAALSETVDPTRVTASKSQLSLTLAERGALVTTTSKLRNLSFRGVDQGIATLVGLNMSASLDTLARETLDGGTKNIVTAGTISSISATDVIDANDFRSMYAKLKTANVPGFAQFGGQYLAIVHPNVLATLKEQTGTGKGTLKTAHEALGDRAGLLNGVAGSFEGFVIVESSRAKITSSTVSVYNSYFLGQDAAGMAVGIAPEIRTSGPFDGMQRLVNIAWYGLVGFGRLRSDSLQIVQSASTFNN